MITRCPLCGKEFDLTLDDTIGDITIQCPQCNTSFVAKNKNEVKESSNKSNTLIVHGYEEWFAICPKIKIFKDEVLIGKVSRKGIFPIEIDKDCTLKFKNGLRNTLVNVKKGVDTHILLYVDRFTGAFKAMTANDDNLDLITNSKEQKSWNATIISMIFIAILIMLAIFMWLIAPSLRHY